MDLMEGHPRVPEGLLQQQRMTDPTRSHLGIHRIPVGERGLSAQLLRPMSKKSTRSTETDLTVDEFNVPLAGEHTAVGAEREAVELV